MTPRTGGAQAAPQSIQSRIDEAAPGEIVYIDPGIYSERIVIDKAVKLKGMNDPVIDGGGEGDVVLITADGASISGFDIRNGGKKFSEEAAGVKVEGADGVEVATNSIEDVRFGIYLVDSEDATVAYNTIVLQPDVDVARRGYGIYLWEVKRSGLFNNAVKSAGDGIHLEFSEGITIGENTVQDSRYGLHFMYSDGNKVVSNVFRDNLAGAVLMFSHNMLLKDNDLSSNRKGASGVGALFKDCDDVFAEGNRFLRNKFGITVDGTPQEVGSTAVFAQNLFALNDTGIGLMSNSPIMFVENAMIDNTVQVTALGGALTSSPAADGVLPVSGSGSGSDSLPDGITWSVAGRGNYWSDYHGYDRNGDGVGDIPYEPQPPFAGALADNDSLRLFQFTLAQEAIDMAADMFPLYRYDAVMADDSPLMSPPGPALSTESEFDRGLFAVSALLLAISGLALAALLDIDFARVTRGFGGRRPQEGGA
ncbi:MAG TPA: nitrous oxide reductase family maturation protein NosD [Dehalococcoidia bacterium]